MKETDEISTQEMLDWLLERIAWPWKISMSGPAAVDRGNGFEWQLSFEKQGEGYVGDCVYASTKYGVIVKAMRVLAAQEEAKAMVAKARA